jgi:hypothetical protein
MRLDATKPESPAFGEIIGFTEMMGFALLTNATEPVTQLPGNSGLMSPVLQLINVNEDVSTSGAESNLHS